MWAGMPSVAFNERIKGGSWRWWGTEGAVNPSLAPLASFREKKRRRERSIFSLVNSQQTFLSSNFPLPFDRGEHQSSGYSWITMHHNRRLSLGIPFFVSTGDVKGTLHQFQDQFTQRWQYCSASDNCFAMLLVALNDLCQVVKALWWTACLRNHVKMLQNFIHTMGYAAGITKKYFFKTPITPRCIARNVGLTKNIAFLWYGAPGVRSSLPQCVSFCLAVLRCAEEKRH